MLKDVSKVVQAAVLPPLAYLQSADDPGYESKITRITGPTGQPTPIGGVWSADSRHHYSKDQPWNDDGTMIWLEQKGVYPSKMIVDAATYKPIIGNRDCTRNSSLLNQSYECRWRPGYPTQMVSWFKAQQMLVVWDVLEERVIRTIYIPGDASFGWLSEGTISDDGRWTVLATSFEKPALTGLGDYFVIVDLEEGRAGPRNDISYFTQTYPTDAYGQLGNINISTRGNYVMGKLRSKQEYGFVFKVDKQYLTADPVIMASNGLRMGATQLDRNGWIACMSHADMNETPDGQEIVCGGVRLEEVSNFCNDADKDNLGCVIAVALDSGVHWHISGGREVTGLKEAGDQHTSGRAYKARGWHLVTYACPAETSGQYTDELVLWKTDGSYDCIRYGVTRTNDKVNYRSEAHGVPSPKADKVMLASNWLGGSVETPGPSGESKAYVYELASSTPPPNPDVPPVPSTRYIIDSAWTYAPEGAIMDTKNGRLVPLFDLVKLCNEHPLS